MKNIMKKILLTIMILIALYRVTSSQPSEVAKELYYSEDSINKLNKSFELYQNYPRQFNEVTSIKFDIYSEGNVKLQVFDSVGKLVETLADGIMEAGTYNVYFKAESGLVSGVYNCKLDVDGSSQSKDMLLVR
ncbi:MAG: hypothetical protein ABI462_04645 [Ignavibacteria bacterium]